MPAIQMLLEYAGASFELAPEDQWYGDLTLTTRPWAAILNSRQAKYPMPGSPWIRRTLEAASWATQHGHAILTSVGMNTWETALWAASEVMGETVVLFPVTRNLGSFAQQKLLDALIRDFRLSLQQTLVIPFYRSTRQKENWLARDRWILAHAQTLIPVSIRRSGSMAENLGQDPFRNRLLSLFQTAHAIAGFSHPRPPKPDEVRELPEFEDSTYVFHWTRCSSSPWPGELSAEFYSSLAERQNHYPHTALATLQNILATGKIHATRWRMPMLKPMVSFSACTPREMVAMMTWRARHVRPNFEPYAIAIRKDILLKTGAREIMYGGASIAKSLPLSDRPFYQSLSPRGYDWSREKEWRLQGDLDLKELPAETVQVLVRTKEEAALIHQVMPYRVTALI